MIQGSSSETWAREEQLNPSSLSLFSLYHLLSHFSLLSSPPLFLICLPSLPLSPFSPSLPSLSPLSLPLSSPLTSNFSLTLSTPSLPHPPLLRHLGLDLVPRKDFEMVDEDQISVSDLYKMVRISAMEPLEPFGTFKTFLIYRS